MAVDALGELSRSEVTAQRRLFGLSGDAPRGVRLFTLRYRTVDAQGRAIDASGMVALPDDARGTIRTISYQHGTVTLRGDVPSRGNSEATLVALALAAENWGVVACDYLGLGDSPGIHPYLHAETEASAALDALVAARNASVALGASLTGPLALAGYSQGGHATLALLRALQEINRPEFAVNAVVAGGGPYDLDGVVLPDLFARPSPSAALYLGYLLLGYDRVYDLYTNLTDAVAEPFAARLLSALDGSHDLDSAIGILGATPSTLLTPAFLAQLQDPSSRPRTLLAQNSVLDFTPQAPLLLAHAHSDEVVSFANAQKAHDTFAARGANVTLLDLGDNLTHASAVLPALPAVLAFLNNHA